VWPFRVYSIASESGRSLGQFTIAGSPARPPCGDTIPEAWQSRISSNKFRVRAATGQARRAVPQTAPAPPLIPSSEAASAHNPVGGQPTGAPARLSGRGDQVGSSGIPADSGIRRLQRAPGRVLPALPAAPDAQRTSRQVLRSWQRGQRADPRTGPSPRGSPFSRGPPGRPASNGGHGPCSASCRPRPRR